MVQGCLGYEVAVDRGPIGAAEVLNLKLPIVSASSELGVMAGSSLIVDMDPTVRSTPNDYLGGERPHVCCPLSGVDKESSC